MSAARDAANRDARCTALLVVAIVALTIGLAWVVFGQEPSPTPTMLHELIEPTPMVTPGWVDTVTRPLVNFFGAHPWLLLVIFVAVCTVNGLRAVWPVRAERPKWVAFVIGMTDPFAMNFWAAIRWVAAKTGFPIWAPDDSPSQSGRVPEKKT